MAHPLFARLERQLELVKRELGNARKADLVDTMAVEVKGVRPAVLGAATRELMHEVRKFRHVVRHKYALELRRRDVARNFALAKKLVPAFERDWRRFAAAMLEEAA